MMACWEQAETVRTASAGSGHGIPVGIGGDNRRPVLNIRTLTIAYLPVLSGAYGERGTNMQEISITYKMREYDGELEEASITLPMCLDVARDLVANGEYSTQYIIRVSLILEYLCEIQGCEFVSVSKFEDVTPHPKEEDIIKCRICGDTFTPEDIDGMGEFGDPFYYESGVLICPDCYDSFSCLTLEDQMDTLTKDW